MVFAAGIESVAKPEMLPQYMSEQLQAARHIRAWLSALVGGRVHAPLVRGQGACFHREKQHSTKQLIFGSESAHKY